MLWYNHRIVSASIVFCLTGQLAPMILAYKGSTIPDQVEGSNYASEAWAINHRMSSHYWFFYLIPFVFSTLWLESWTLSLTRARIMYMLYDDPESTLILFAVYAVQWLSFGSLMHIVEDFFCGKVPGVTVAHRIGIRIFYVGSAQEFYCTVIVAFVCFLARLFWAPVFFVGI